MKKVYLLLLVGTLFCSMTPECSVSFDCKPSVKSQSGVYSLELTLKEGESGTYQFDLYDLNTGSVVQSRSMYFASGESKQVFSNVKPSTYTVSYTGGSCKEKKAIQGKGIILV